jgi:hypothetical protein
MKSFKEMANVWTNKFDLKTLSPTGPVKYTVGGKRFHRMGRYFGTHSSNSVCKPSRQALHGVASLAKRRYLSMQPSSQYKQMPQICFSRAETNARSVESAQLRRNLVSYLILPGLFMSRLAKAEEHSISTFPWFSSRSVHKSRNIPHTLCSDIARSKVGPSAAMATENIILLISGATRGIGRGLTEAFAARPSHTIIAAVCDTSHSTTKSLASFPCGGDSRIIVVKLDSKSPTDAAAAIKQLGIDKIDTVIANAALSNCYKSVLETPRADLQEHFAVNAGGTLALFQATIRC